MYQEERARDQEEQAKDQEERVRDQEACAKQEEDQKNILNFLRSKVMVMLLLVRVVQLQVKPLFG